MSIRRRGNGNPAHGINPSTVAFIYGEQDSPDYPVGMVHFWHEFSVAKGHRHASWGYNVEDACEALGVDFEAVKARPRFLRPMAAVEHARAMGATGEGA